MKQFICGFGTGSETVPTVVSVETVGNAVYVNQSVKGEEPTEYNSEDFSPVSTAEVDSLEAYDFNGEFAEAISYIRTKLQAGAFGFGYLF
jgi:hypothetical protein